MEGAFSSEEKKKIQQEREKNWVHVQIKGLSAWMNSYLQSAGLPLIKDLQADLQDGVKLNQFLTVLSGKKLSFDLTPQMKIHKIQNLSTAITFVQETLEVKLIGISAEDIERGDIKLILGLIYSIFRKVRISKIATQLGENDKKKSEAQQLIAWMNTLVENEPYELKLETFKDEPFKNGKAFGALLHAYNEDLLDYESLGNNPEENLKKIFELYEQKLGIPQLLDVTEVVNGTVDERAMTLYCSLIYHAHASQEERKKLEEGSKEKEEQLNKERLSKKRLEEEHGQLLSEKERLELEKAELEKSKLEELEKRRRAEERENELKRQLEEERRKLEEEKERLRKEKEELERQRLEQERLRINAEKNNQSLSQEKNNMEKEKLSEMEERKRLELLNKKLLEEFQAGLANQLNLRDQLLFLYQSLMDERYQDIEDFIDKSNKENGTSSSSSGNSTSPRGGNNSPRGGNTSPRGENSGNSSESGNIGKRNTRVGKGGENEGGNNEEGQTGLKNNKDRIIRTLPIEDPKFDLTTPEGIEKEKQRNALNQKRLQQELEELKERIKKEIQRRRKDALKLQQYEEKLKEYESKAIEQGEANRALDILKKNLTEHVEDLKAWVELSELDLDSEKKERYDPSLVRANLKDKKFEEQIDYLAEKLHSENDSMRRIIQIKDSKKQLYDNYADKQGWLHMKTDEKAQWKSQWFVLKGSELSYYPTEEKKDRAGGINIDSTCVISSDKSEGQNIFPIKISVKDNQFFIATTTKKAKKEWTSALKGKVIFAEYMNQIEESKTRPDIRLSNVLYATVDLGSIRMDNAPISKHTVGGISNALPSFEDLNVVTFSSSEFTDELASILAPSLKKSFIRNIQFSDNHLTGEGAKLICDSLSDNRSVESIDFSENEIGDNGAASLASLISQKKVSSINLENNKLTGEGAKKILEALAEHPKWTNLQFNGNQLGDDGCAFVANLISKNSVITEIQLARNRISDEGVKQLCSALKNNTSITHIDLSGNLLTQTSISYINDLLKDNKFIKLLNLSENPQIIGGKGIEGVFTNEAFSLASFSLMRLL